MIHTLVLDRDSRTFTHVAEADAISALCSNHSKIVWVDVSDPTSHNFDNLAKQFGFHPLSIEDCRRVLLYRPVRGHAERRGTLAAREAWNFSWEKLPGHSAQRIDPRR